MAGVKLTAIHKAFADPAGNRFEAVRGVDLEIRAGECFSLLGPSGCGKTTLLRIISGLELPDSGTVEMDGRDVTALPPEKRPTAMVFQSYALFPHLTVQENVAFGLKIRKRPRPEIESKVGEALERVQLTGLNKRKIDELSGGQQQRVALARVLALEPKILLMDEPLSNLDAALRRTTRGVIRKIQSELGITLIYVTHDQEEGLMISDRLALMKEGLLLQTGSPQDLFERPASAEVARFLGQRNMIEAIARRKDGDGVQFALTAAEDCPLVRIEANGAGVAPEPGERVWLAIRTDELVVADERTTPAGVGWPGEVAMTSFGGSALEVEIRLEATGQIVRMAHDLRAGPPESPAGSPAPARGDKVRLTVRPQTGLVYPREGASSAD